ncbi:MAG TPA: phosphatase PAP2 family protein [Cyclobacteriaceae bacterium]|nr:phosphatase PAP2 family protein [Cyclobacteriaceae bacterium]
MIIAVLQQLMDWDRRLLVWLNGFHADWLDPVMYYTSQTLFWLPLYLFLIGLIIKDFKKESWIPLIGIGLTILLADQVTASLMKPFFARLRPSQEPALAGIVHLVRDRNGEIYTGGLYGFASSHAANTFATAAYFTLLFRPKHRWITWLFLWAAAMTYTRIYLGAHYPGDILAGSLVGIASAFAGFKVYEWITKKRGSSLHTSR